MFNAWGERGLCRDKYIRPHKPLFGNRTSKIISASLSASVFISSSPSLSIPPSFLRVLGIELRQQMQSITLIFILNRALGVEFLRNYNWFLHLSFQTNLSGMKQKIHVQVRTCQQGDFAVPPPLPLSTYIVYQIIDFNYFCL